MSSLLRRTLPLVGAICLISASTARAAEEEGGVFSPKNFTSTLSMTSDYMFRGISQTNANPAVQGSFDYAHPIGLYAGVWASNVAFGGSIEMDWYAGYRNTVGGFSYDVGALYYAYPQSHDDPEFNYLELAAKAAYTFKLSPVEPTISLGYYFSPDFFGEDGKAHYVNGKVSLGLPLGFAVAGEAGYQYVEGDETTGDGNGLDGDDGYDYVHYRFGVSKSDLAGFNLDLSFHGMTEATFFRRFLAGERLVFTVSRTF